MKILFVLDYFYPHVGGAETLFYNLITKLAKNKNFQIKVITTASSNYRGLKFFNNFEVEYFDWKSIFNHPLPNLFDLYKEIKKFDIVHTSTYTAAFFSFFISFFMKKKIIITVYENLGFKWFFVDNFLKSFIFYIFERFTIHLPFNKYIAISKSTKKDLEASGIPSKKILIVYPFIENRHIQVNLKKDNFYRKKNKYFLFFGRPGKTKGIFILLKAISYVKRHIPKNFSFLFVLANEPEDERKKVIDYIKKNNLDNLIRVMPSKKRKELILYIKESYCVIVPSITEGFGLSAYESILLGKPIIVSDAGSLPEIASGKYLIFKNRDFKDLGNKIKLAIDGFFLKKKIFKVEAKKEVKKIINLYYELFSYR